MFDFNYTRNEGLYLISCFLLLWRPSWMTAVCLVEVDQLVRVRYFSVAYDGIHYWKFNSEIYALIKKS